MKDILYNLAQIGLTVSLVALIPLLLRKVLKKRYPARAMCLVWAVLAVRLLIPLQLTVPEPPVQVTPRTNYVLHDVRNVPTLPVDYNFNDSRWVSNSVAATLGNADETSVTTFDVGAVLAYIWAFGAMAYLIWQLWSYARFRKALMRSGCAVKNPVLLEVLEKQKLSLGIKRDIPLIVSCAADCPMLAGYLNPVLFLPDEGLPEQDAGFIFRHELTHYKHGDLWLKLLLVLARAVQWFNPLIHLMARFAQEDIELACDAAVAKNMDTAQRRAYGETILRSAIAQAKRRTMISYWGGDKEEIMRRFEGLFDRTVKRRGIALVLVMAVTVMCVGAAFSIGNGETLSDAEKVSLVEAWARDEGYGEFAVKITDGHIYLISDQPAGVAGEIGSEIFDGYTKVDDSSAIVGTIGGADGPTAIFTTGEETDTRRVAQEVHFSENGIESVDELDSENVIHIADSLEHFKILFENDLGLPDPVEKFESIDLDGVRDIDKRSHVLGETLQLQVGAYVSTFGVENQRGIGIPDKPDDLIVYTASFMDGSQVDLTLVDQFGEIQLVQDWTEYNSRVNGRTAADLARQFARGVQHKSGQFVYPILSKELQAEFIEYQKHGGDEWYWKLGGSSPSYKDFVLVPTEDENVYIAVFQKYGGGMTDARSAHKVTVGKEDGRSVITKVEECYIPEYTQSKLFELYYNTGLAWPEADSTAQQDTSYNLGTYADLLEPDTAAQTVFGFHGQYVEQQTPEGTSVQLESWITKVKVQRQTETEAIVMLTFQDGSLPADIMMHRDDNSYWLPVGIAGNNFSDFPLNVGVRVGNTLINLPIGKTAAEVLEKHIPVEIPLGSKFEVKFRADVTMTDMDSTEKPVVSDLPLAPGGSISAPQPLDEGETVIIPGPDEESGEVQTLPLVPADPQTSTSVPESVTIRDSLIRPDGSLMFGSKVSEVTEVPIDHGIGRYTVKRNNAKLLSSIMMDSELRGIEISYELNGETYSFSTVFRTGRTGAARVLDTNTYTNNYYGYTLTLPESFAKYSYVKEDENGIPSFGMVTTNYNTEGEPKFDPECFIMMLNVVPTDYLIENNGTDWEGNYPLPCKKITERNGMSYFLVFASDVQYDPANAAMAEQYNKMLQDANGMDGSSLKFMETKGEDFLTRETERRLWVQGYNRTSDYIQERNAVQEKSINPKDVMTVTNSAITPHAEDMSCDIVYWMSSENDPIGYHRCERAVFSEDSLELVSVKEICSSGSKGTTLEKFLTLYDNELGLPILWLDGILKLQSDQGQGVIDLSSPEKGALRYGMSEAYATYEETENVSDDLARVTYNFWDTKDPSRMKPSGNTLTLEMRKVQPDGSMPAIWLAEGWEVQQSDGTGIVNSLPYSIYDKNVYSQAASCYQYRSTSDLFRYLELAWVEDKWYKDRIFEELDKRRASDPEGFDKLLEEFASATDGERVYNIKDLWQEHLAQGDEEGAVAAEPVKEPADPEPTKEPGAEGTASDLKYENKRYGYTLELPDSWSGKYTAVSSGNNVFFYQKAAYDPNKTMRGLLCVARYRALGSASILQTIIDSTLNADEDGRKYDTSLLSFRGGSVLTLQCITGPAQTPAQDSLDEYNEMAADCNMIRGHINAGEWRFSEKEIKDACKAVTDYAAEHNFTVENLRYDGDTELRWSLGIMSNGVLSDNEGLSVTDIITVKGDAEFGEGAWRDSAEGWSFTLYRDADGRWILEDGAFGY